MTIDNLAVEELGETTDQQTSTSDAIVELRSRGTGDAADEGAVIDAVRVPRGTSTQNLRLFDWLFRSRGASALWLVVRLWLGYQWLNAGYQKIWGSEHSAFFFGGGAGVKGFATASILGSAAGKGGASYGWWAAFLHNFVIPNAPAIGKVVSLGELLIGVGLIVGLFTGAAAFAGLLLNLTYMFSGSAGVNPMYAIVGLLLVLAWRKAGWIGLDGLFFRRQLTPQRMGGALAPSLVDMPPLRRPRRSERFRTMKR